MLGNRRKLVRGGSCLLGGLALLLLAFPLMHATPVGSDGFPMKTDGSATWETWKFANCVGSSVSQARFVVTTYETYMNPSSSGGVYGTHIHKVDERQEIVTPSHSQWREECRAVPTGKCQWQARCEKYHGISWPPPATVPIPLRKRSDYQGCINRWRAVPGLQEVRKGWKGYTVYRSFYKCPPGQDCGPNDVRCY